MKTPKFKFADFHCHPILKTYGHSFSDKDEGAISRSHIWYCKPPTAFTKTLNALTGLTKFTQADFTTLSKANVKVAVVSMYPLEKGFFINGFMEGLVLAHIANLITSIGFKRVRHLQKHTDYFLDLVNEYNFFKNSCMDLEIDGQIKRWRLAGSWFEVKKILDEDHCMAVIPTIEGGHVFNTGLSSYGRPTQEEEMFQNIETVKNWEYPPLFITLAHNFNNDLCGHARNLDRLGPFANQLENINTGFTPLGIKVVRALLDNTKRPVFIDIKHMSLKSRLQYYDLIENEYDNKIPVLVSHGAVTGVDLSYKQNTFIPPGMLSTQDINFFDEELVIIAKTRGLFSLQMDSRRFAHRKLVRKSLRQVFHPNAHKQSAAAIWLQLQHIAEILDSHQLFAWGTACIGSDFDGTINPLNGLWTAEQFPLLAEELLVLASDYLHKKNGLIHRENSTIMPEEIVERFIFINVNEFLQYHYR
jgi:microsomal dipeptidase-like Zn-dependent dipeptidase